MTARVRSRLMPQIKGSSQGSVLNIFGGTGMAAGSPSTVCPVILQLRNTISIKNKYRTLNDL